MNRSRLDRVSLIASVMLAVFIVTVSAVATFSGVPTAIEPPAAEAPTYTLVAQFEGPESCVRGWTLVSAETVWRVPYIPQVGWAFTDATQAQLEAAYTRPGGRVARAALTSAQGRMEELTRVRCRFAPLSSGDAPAD